RRRQGHVRRLLTRALTEYREEGIDLAALWPFAVGFYRKLGWGIANKYTVYDLPPEQLAFGSDPEGSVRRLGPDDWNHLRRVEVAFGEGTMLSLRRTERWWRDRTLSAWDGRSEPYVYGYRRDGELRGYVLHTVERTDDGSQLRVADLAHADDDAYRGLLRFLSAHDSQVDSVRLPRKEESELLDRVSDPGAVDCTVNVGPMIRLTDVERALEGRAWPEGADVQFTLSVSDPLLEYNDETFDVRVTDGGATVEAADPGPRGSADVEADVGTLSRLFVGSLGIDDAQRTAGLTIRDDRLREPLRGSFPQESVCMREFF
ncbi:MAG: GNAT family N-acetyltransferase, partial [Haloferacaceae archaeon]